MYNKRQQLRAELRGHLLQVLQERGVPDTVSSSVLINGRNRDKQETYHRLFRIQPETARVRELEESPMQKVQEEFDWFTHSFGHSDNTQRRFLLSPDEQRKIYLEQIEVKQKRDEEERRRENESFWEDYAVRDPGDKGDFYLHLETIQNQARDLEVKIKALTKELQNLRFEEKKLIEEIRTVTQVKPKFQFSEGSDFESVDENSKETSQLLQVTSKYFVYVAKPTNQLSPKTPTDPRSLVDENEDQSVFENEFEQTQEFNDEVDSSEEEDDYEGTSEAARAALARADSPSSDDRLVPSNVSINTFLEGEIPIETPRSRISKNSYDNSTLSS